MMVRLPHSLQTSRQVVRSSASEVMMTGALAVPRTLICAPRQTARLPPRFAVLAMSVPASMVRVAPGRT